MAGQTKVWEWKQLLNIDISKTWCTLSYNWGLNKIDFILEQIRAILTLLPTSVDETGVFSRIKICAVC